MPTTSLTCKHSSHACRHWECTHVPWRLRVVVPGRSQLRCSTPPENTTGASQRLPEVVLWSLSSNSAARTPPPSPGRQRRPHPPQGSSQTSSLPSSWRRRLLDVQNEVDEGPSRPPHNRSLAEQEASPRGDGRAEGGMQEAPVAGEWFSRQLFTPPPQPSQPIVSGDVPLQSRLRLPSP